MSTKRTYIGHESFLRLPLYAEDGTVLSPTVSLAALLEDGPVPERDLLQLAQEFDHPEVIPNTLAKLGAIRVRQDDGTVLVMLSDEPSFKHAIEPGTDNDGMPSPRPTSTSAAGGSRVSISEGSASLAVSFADHHSSALDDYERTGNLGAMVPLREATRK